MSQHRTDMNEPRKTVVVTGASRGIGAGLTRRFAERGFNVVASARRMTGVSEEVVQSDRVAVVDGDIGEEGTAARIVETALSRFHSLDALVNNAGVFVGKAFTDYTSQDVRRIFATNAEGLVYVTQAAIRQMLAQGTGGSIVTITAALASNAVRGVNASVSMFTKGGLQTLTRHLAMEYAREGIRVNAVAPGVVDSPLEPESSREAMKGDSPMGRPSTVEDIMNAVMYLTDAPGVTGDILYVDGGAHLGRW
jgi:NAD(P)-dependent dehydrogenase (short-subunit alcohol dehydrogenase family)